MSASSPPSPENDSRLLVVDDDPQTGEVLRSWFASQGTEVLVAADAATGVAQAIEFQPDVILMDLNMPGEDGITASRRIKGHPATGAIPVILLTAVRDLDSKVEAFRAGADDYITKPFDCEEIAARIGLLLQRRSYLVSLESRIQDLQHSNEQLEELLMIDEKTGLYNFREFQRRLKAEWERATRYDVPLSLIFLDLDRFKQVNDTLGHQAGDELLREFGMLVAGGARANDIAARYGGEEFAVVLPHTDPEMAERVAERILNAVREFVFLETSRPTRVTVSGGVATFPSDAAIDSIESLIRAADMALYAAKEGGRDRVCFAGRHRAVER